MWVCLIGLLRQGMEDNAKNRHPVNRFWKQQSPTPREKITSSRQYTVQFYLLDVAGYEPVE